MILIYPGESLHFIDIGRHTVLYILDIHSVIQSNTAGWNSNNETKTSLPVLAAPPRSWAHTLALDNISGNFVVSLFSEYAQIGDALSQRKIKKRFYSTHWFKNLYHQTRPDLPLLRKTGTLKLTVNALRYAFLFGSLSKLCTTDECEESVIDEPL